MKRQIYLRIKPLDEARGEFLKRFPMGGWRDAEEVSVLEACGRVTAQPVFARFSSPPFHAAAMDGVAVRAEETFGAHVDRPVQLRLGREAHPVNTGQPLPAGTNAVIMIEDVVEVDKETVQIEAPAYPWQHVRRVGEDIVATQLLFPQNHRLTPYDLGALLGAGVTRIRVRSRPLVVIIPTGSELLTPEEIEEVRDPVPGRIVEFNSVVLAEMVRLWGGAPVRYPVVPDEPERLQREVVRALDEGADVVVINAGSSAGSADYTYHVIQAMGEVVVHGISMMPGKPTVLGVVRDRPVIGNPGYPVSAVVSCEQIVAPLIARLLGIESDPRPTVRATTSRKVPSKLGIEEFVRVRLGFIGDHIVATPLPRGAGSITTLTQADGFLRIPQEVEGHLEGEEVEVELLRPLQEIRRTLVAIGSHDLSLDLIADRLQSLGRGFRLASSNVGSLGGLLAIRKGHAHLAGTHLLDPESGQYNLPYLERYLRDTPVRLVHLVRRQQGLMVAPGNPLGIEGLKDLTRSEITFVNRQAGSGTRLLLDYHLAKVGVDPSQIRGYGREEYTHMSVAVAVRSGTADAGLGVLAAAKALGLDFIPIATEQYDLVIPEAFWETEGIQLLLEIIASEEFRSAVESMGGYDASDSGRRIL